MGSLVSPTFMTILLTGPPSEKRAKKSIAKAEAMMRLGI